MQSVLDDVQAALTGAVDVDSWWQLGVLLAAALLVGWIAYRVVPRFVRNAIEATSTQWDDALLARGVLRQLGHLAPLLVVYLGLGAVPALQDEHLECAGRGLLVLVVGVSARPASRLLSAANDLYDRRDVAHRRPIKGYVQLGKLVVYLVAAILAVAALVDRSPLLLLSGLGALGAVLMLVFKDTILSLVASVQIASNDLLRLGDWIEMPSLGVDGDVIDIALHTVKVQNFDKTIVTIPTHRLIDDSFTNWRGMQESGGRRIKRALSIDQTTVRFLDEALQEQLQRFALLEPHFRRKREELQRWNADRGDPVNTRRLTNLGAFRAYVAAYLQSHPDVDEDKTLMVRQLNPGATGIPLEVYCFAATTRWSEYEAIQADIFDHLLAILPGFGLALFQQPTGRDLGRLGCAREAHAGSDAPDAAG
jgi:miniconductance mechanosensitive channel